MNRLAIDVLKAGLPQCVCLVNSNAADVQAGLVGQWFLPKITINVVVWE